MPEQTTASPFTVAIYNPALLNKQDLVRGFVARQPLLERLLDDLRREAPGVAAQHHLIIGQRGLGKTTLLRRLAFAIEDDPVLAATWMPLVFPEEQYNVASLGDFWLNCVDALSDALDRSGDRAASKSLDARVQSVPQAGAGRSAAALNLLLDEADRLQRRVLLLVDNIDIVLDRLQSEEEWEFRRVISQERRLHFIGASSRALEALYEYGRPFYEFFQTHELKGFDEKETFSTLTQLAEQSGNAQVAQVVREQSGRIKALRVLTGGNPRTLVLLFKVLAQGPEGDVQRDIEQLLDEYTALYKARFEELAPQAQQVVDAMAIHWDPLTAADLAERLGPLGVNQVSAQLKRLEDFGVVEKTPWFGEKKNAFQIAERFFNIWYLMRASRRVRRRLLWLVKFLETWFDREELHARAQSFLERDPDAMGRERYADLALAYSQAVPDRHLRRNLESAGLHAVLDDGVRRLIDFSDLPPELQDKKDRIEQLRELREKTCNLKIQWDGINPAEFWRLLGGSPHFSLTEKARMVEQLPSLTPSGLQELYAKLKLFEERLRQACFGYAADVAQLYKALAGGEMAGVYDYENAIAIAKRHGLHGLPVFAVAARANISLHREKLSEAESRMAESALRAMTREPGFEAFAWNGLGNLLQDHLERYEEAEQAYRQAIELDPQSAYPWNGLGGLLQDHLKRYEEAEQAYRRSIELDPQYADPWNDLGNLLKDHLQRYEEAEQAYRRSIELDPEDASTWSDLGNLLQEYLECYAEAEQAYRRSIELDPEDAWTWSDLGNLLQDHLKRYEEAEQAYRRAIELDSEEATVWSDLGNLLIKHLERYEEAEQAYRYAIELDSEGAYAWNNLGNLLTEHLKRYEEAEQAYRRSIELEPQRGAAWNNLGNLLADHLKRYEEAEQAYRRSIELDPQDAHTWNNLGNLLQDHLEHYEEAEQAYRRSIELDPQNAFAWNGLGKLLTDHMERYEEAEKIYRRAIELDPQYPFPWNNLGDLLAEHLKRYEDAEQAYRQAIKLNAQYAIAWDNLGDLLADHMERYKDAEQAYHRAIELDPQYAIAWKDLGDLLAGHLERYEEAEQAYRRVIELDSQDAFAWINLGNLLEGLDRLQEAGEVYRRALEIARASYWDLEGTLRNPLGESSNESPALQMQFLLARMLTVAGSWSEASKLLEQLAANESAFFSTGFFRAVVKTNHLEDAIAILERAGANERWRPLYEALQAARAGTPDYLRTVAPEVRMAASEILQELAPELFDGREQDG